MSDRVLRKIVDDRRRRQQMCDEMQEVGAMVRRVLRAAEGHARDERGIGKVYAYMQRYNQQVKCKVIGGLFSVLESFYN